MRICAGLHSHKVAVWNDLKLTLPIYMQEPGNSIYMTLFFNASEFGLSGIFCYCTLFFCDSSSLNIIS